MHPNPAFRSESADRHFAFARGRGFGVLSINGAAGPLASHVPFLLAGDCGSAEMHLVALQPDRPGACRAAACPAGRAGA